MTKEEFVEKYSNKESLEDLYDRLELFCESYCLDWEHILTISRRGGRSNAK